MSSGIATNAILPPPLVGGGNSIEHSEIELGEGCVGAIPLPQASLTSFAMLAPSRKGRGDSYFRLES